MRTCVCRSPISVYSPQPPKGRRECVKRVNTDISFHSQKHITCEEEVLEEEKEVPSYALDSSLDSTSHHSPHQQSTSVGTDQEADPHSTADG